MTLEEVVYQIDGAVKTEFVEGSGPLHRIILLDNIEDVVTIMFTGTEAKSNVPAMAIGNTPEEARKNLVELMHGNILVHSWPIMWTSSEVRLRIPETLS